MKNLQISEANARKLYQTAAPEFKQTLEDTFGKEFFAQHVTDPINSVDMLGKYLAEDLRRTWTEDFVDEDTRAVVPIERSELIFGKGAYIGMEQLSEINFFILANAIKELTVSNQDRKAYETAFSYNLWLGVVEFGDSKRRKVIFYAKGLKMAYDILTDWYELNFSGSFHILSLREQDRSVVLENLPESDDEVKFYETEVKIKSPGAEFTQTFIVHTCDTDRVIEAIQTFYAKSNPDETREIKFEQIKIMPYHNVIDPEFSRVYIEENDKQA